MLISTKKLDNVFTMILMQNIKFNSDLKGEYKENAINKIKKKIYYKNKKKDSTIDDTIFQRNLDKYFNI